MYSRRYYTRNRELDLDIERAAVRSAMYSNRYLPSYAYLPGYPYLPSYPYYGGIPPSSLPYYNGYPYGSPYGSPYPYFYY